MKKKPKRTPRAAINYIAALAVADANPTPDNIAKMRKAFSRFIWTF